MFLLVSILSALAWSEAWAAFCFPFSRLFPFMRLGSVLPCFGCMLIRVDIFKAEPHIRLDRLPCGSSYQLSGKEVATYRTPGSVLSAWA